MIMSLVVALLTSFGQSLLKIFLSGLFDTVLTKIQDDAQHSVDAAQFQAQTVQEASAVEVHIAQQQAQVAIDASKPRPTDDPFGVDKFNGGK